MKKIILSLFIILPFISFTQESLSYFNIALSKKNQTFTFVDKQKDEGYVFVSNNQSLKTIRFDSNFIINDSLTSNRPSTTYENIIGANKNENSVNLYWSTENNEKICRQTINLSDKITSIKTYTLNFSKQKILQCFSTNDKFYILTIAKESNILKFFIFSNEEIVKEEDIDLSKTTFYNSDQKIVNLYEVFNESLKSSFDSSFEFPIIDIDNPLSLSITAKKRKCYFRDNEIIITIDTNPNFTQLITLNLLNFTYSTKNLSQKDFQSNKNQLIKHNSLIVDNNIFQINLTKEKMVFTISDFNDKILKQFTVNKNEDVSFKNSKLIYDYINNYYKNSKNQKTDTFFEDLLKSNVGIVYYRYNDKNLISIGSASKHIDKITEDEHESKAFLSNYGLIGALIYVTFYNQNQVNLDFSRDYIYFNSLFDNNYNNEKEKISYYTLDLIKKYFFIDRELIYPTLLTLKKGHIFGYYKPSIKLYSFKKINRE